MLFYLQRNIDQKKREFLEGGTVGNTKVTYKDFLRDKYDAVKEVKNAKFKFIDQIKEVQSQMEELEAERQAIQKEIPKGTFKTPQDVQDAIKTLNRKYEQSNMTPNEEKKLIAEINTLKKAVPKIEKMLAIKPEVDILKQK